MTIQDLVSFHELSVSSQDMIKAGVFSSDPIGKIQLRPQPNWHRVTIPVKTEGYLVNPSHSLEEWIHKNTTKRISYRWFTNKQTLVIYFENINDALKFKLVDYTAILKEGEAF